MPKITIPLPNVSQSVSRPVIVDIIQQVQNLTHISKDTKIFYPGDIQRMQTPGSGIDGATRSAVFNSDRYTFIEVEEDYDLDSMGSTAIDREEHIPVFTDDKLEVELTPIYVTNNVTINFTYRCPSKSEALRWRDEARVRISQMYDVNLHDVTYHYGIPEDALLILNEIHRLREAKAGYSQTFVDYVKSFSTERLTLMSDVTGSSANLAVTETQTRIQGMYAFDGMPEKATRDETTGTWSITFSYKFNYEKPISCRMKYPVMVHNQLLPLNLIEFTNKALDLNKINKSFSKSLSAMNSFEMHTNMNAIHNSDFIIRIPEYDDFLIPSILPGSGTVLVALVSVDETDNRTLVNLTELGDILIDPDVLQFIREVEYPYITRHYASILTLSLYRNNYLTRDNTISCGSNLNVKANDDLDIRNQYRVRLGINVDITMLPPSAFDRLRSYPKVLVKLIGAMNELLRFNPDFINLGDKKIVSHRDFSDIYSFLTGFRMPGRPNTLMNLPNGTTNLFSDIDQRIVENYRRNHIGRSHVMVSSVVALRKDPT